MVVLGCKTHHTHQKRHIMPYRVITNNL